MCGICGIFNYKNEMGVKESDIKKMCSTMVHRGPDDEGLYVGFKSGQINKVGLGIRRLAIIDLVTGHQPIHNEDKSIFIVLNGEIYNFIELRKLLEEKGHFFYTKSDAETVVHCYEEYGIECLGYLRGMFAFAIWDERKKQLFIARDRIGKKPLVYCDTGNEFIFASELRAIFEAKNINKEIDMEAIDLYLTYQYIPSPLTIYKKVRKLAPASYLIVNEKGNININRYWNISFLEKYNISFEEAKNEFLKIFEESTKIRMISDVPLGAFLSGGIDSSAVVGMMSKLSDRPVKTFSIGFKEQEFSELKYARIVSKHFNTEHNEFIVEPQTVEILPKIVWHYSEPFADSSALPSYYVANITRKYVTVALNGDGGDENFGGYLRYMALRVSEIISKIPGATNIMSLMSGIFPLTETTKAKHPFRYYKRFLSAVNKEPHLRNLEWHSYFTKEYKDFIYTEEMKNKLSEIDAYNYLSNIFLDAPAKEILDKSFYTDLVAYLPECLLVKMDIATMANSLEARSPFLDHKIIEFSSKLPFQWKVKFMGTKYFLKKTFRESLPYEILHRGKQGFGIPLGKWFRYELSSYIKEILLSDRAIERNYFKKDNIKILLEEHISGIKDHGYKLWALLMLELWHRVYIDKDKLF